MADTTLPPTFLEDAARRIRDANLDGRAAIDRANRQPVHTVYGGAHLFHRTVAEKIGRVALQALDGYAPDAASFARAVGTPDALAAAVDARVRAKLSRAPVEDLRVDFEDGYGPRPDGEEDSDARRCAEELAAGFVDGALPAFFGVRIKAFSDAAFSRSARTLDLVLTGVAAALRVKGGDAAAFFDRFVVTLPKITTPAHVAVLVDMLRSFEASLGLPARVLRFEAMIEDVRVLLLPDGTIGLPKLLAAADGRLVAAHFGAYDYAASADVTAVDQTYDHALCTWARAWMTHAFAGTGVRLSDGATTVLPVPRHRPAPGQVLTAAQREENRTAVHVAWALHARHVRHSLAHGLYQGWDLHPAQLPARFAALYAFFLEALPTVSARLRRFLDEEARAVTTGSAFDDAATGRGLRLFLQRGLACGALDEAALTSNGLDPAVLRAEGFEAIVEARRPGAPT